MPFCPRSRRRRSSPRVLPSTPGVLSPHPASRSAEEPLLLPTTPDRARRETPVSGASTRQDGRMTLTVLLPTTVPMPDAVPDGTRYVPYDPYTPLPEEHLDAEVLGVWGNPEEQLADAARRLRKLRL